MWDRLSPAILILPLSCCAGPRRARQILIVYVSDMGNNATADTDTGTDLDTRNLAGKPSAGFCSTPSGRIQALYGTAMNVIRCNTLGFSDNRR